MTMLILCLLPITPQTGMKLLVNTTAARVCGVPSSLVAEAERWGSAPAAPAAAAAAAPTASASASKPPPQQHQHQPHHHHHHHHHHLDKLDKEQRQRHKQAFKDKQASHKDVMTKKHRPEDEGVLAALAKAPSAPQAQGQTHDER